MKRGREFAYLDNPDVLKTEAGPAVLGGWLQTDLLSELRAPSARREDLGYMVSSPQ